MYHAFIQFFCSTGVVKVQTKVFAVPRPVRFTFCSRCSFCSQSLMKDQQGKEKGGYIRIKEGERTEDSIFVQVNFVPPKSRTELKI